MFYTMKVVKCCHMLPREVVDSLSLEIVKTWLDIVMGNLLQLTLLLLVQGVCVVGWIGLHDI